MKRTLKIITRVFLYAAAGFVALLALALLFMQTGYFRSQLKKIVIRQVAENTRGTLSVGRIGGSLLGGIVIEDAALNYDGRPVFAAKRIEARYYLPALLRKTLYVERVSISTPSAVLMADGRGELNVTALFRPKKKAQKKRPAGGEPLSVFVETVRLEGGSFFLGTDARASVKVNAIDFTGSVSVTTERQKTTVTAALSSFSCAGIKPALNIRSLSARVRIRGNDILADWFTFTTDGSSGSVTGSALNLSRPRFDVRADLPRVAFSDLRALVPSLMLEGSTAVSVRVKGPIDNARGTVRVAYGDLVLRNDFTANALLPELRLNGSVKNFHPEKILPGCTPRAVSGCPRGTVNAGFSGHYRVDRSSGTQLSFDAAVSSSNLNGLEIMNTQLSARLENRKAALVADLSLASAGSASVRADGVLDPAGRVDMSATAAFSGIDLSRFVPGLPQSGITGGVSARLLKDGRQLAADDVNVQLSSSSVAGFAVDRFSFSGALKGTTLCVSSCSLKGEGVTTLVAGTVPLAGGEVAVSYDVTAANLAVLSKLSPGTAAGGKLKATGAIAGKLNEPQAKGEISVADLALGPLTADSLNCRFALVKKGRYPDGGVELYAGNVGIAGKKIDGLSVQANRDRGTTAFTAEAASGKDSTYRLAGMVEEQRQGARITIDELSVVAGTVTWLNDGPLTALLSRDAVRIDSFTLTSVFQSMNVQGTLSTAAPLNLTVNVTDVELERLRRIAEFDIPVNGRLNVRARVTGRANAPVITARAAIADGSIGAFPLARVAASADYNGGRLRADLIVEGIRGRALCASATVPMDLSLNAGPDRLGKSGLEANITSSRFDLSILSAMNPAIERSEGKLSVDVRLTGAVAAPTVIGKLILEDALVRPAATGVDYRAINGTVSFVPGSITVDRLSMRAGDGSGALHGKIALADGAPESFDLALDLRNFKAVNAPYYAGTVYAALRLTGAAKEPLLSGTVRVAEASVNVAQSGPKPVPDVQVVEVAGRAGAALVKKRNAGYSPADAVRVDAAVEIPGNAWVRGQGLNVEAKGKLTVKKGLAEAPKIAGTVTAVRGTFEFRGRLLTIDQGSVVFTGASRIDPLLNVKATTRIASVVITVTVGGTLSKPEINLASIPVMDESDIIAYLLFGKPSARLSESEGSVLATTTVNVLGDIAAKGLKAVIGRELSPDIINVGAGGQEVGVGKYINSRLFVQYEWRLGTEEISQTFIDYQLSDHFTLHSQVGYEPTEGVDLLWRINY